MVAVVNRMEDSIPIVEVTTENIQTFWPTISSAIKNASFIALDCELSGLGCRKELNFPEIDVRYNYISKIASKYCIVSLGLSCFMCKSISSISLDSSKEKGNASVQSHDYFVQTFNILTLCNGNFSVDTDSLKFLMSHGFDFNKLYATGIPYTRGIDNREGRGVSSIDARAIFEAILRHRKPIVFHNGFIDLIFLYQSFYLHLPKHMETFSSDLVDMFPNGIYDTKYIVEFFQKMPATYLEYAFKKTQLLNSSRKEKGNWHIHLTLPPYPASLSNVTWCPYLQVFNQSDRDSDTQLCDSFKYHGNCNRGSACPDSHDVNRIARELNPLSRKRTRLPGVAISSLAEIIRLKAEESNDSTQKKKKMVEKENIPEGNCMNGKDADADGISHSSPELSSDSQSNANNNNNGPLGSQSPNHSESGKEMGESVNLSENSNREGSTNHTENEIVDESEVEKEDRLNHLKNGKICPLETLISESDTEVSFNNNSISLEFDSKNGSSTVNGSTNSGHRAGFDAFMTGYIFASQISIYGKLDTFALTEFKPIDIKMDNFSNKIYMFGKDFPFLVRQGNYSKKSVKHCKKISNIRNEL